MRRLLVKTLMMTIILLAGWSLLRSSQSLARALNPEPPTATVRLVFIHHSVGQELLLRGFFALLNTQNYFVADTYYGWGPADGVDQYGSPKTIGDHTDIGQWYNWYLGPSSATFLDALYNDTDINEDLHNSMDQPDGPNTVVLFKSCFYNSQTISGNPDDLPYISSSTAPNPIWGQDHFNQAVYTVSNIKGMYRDLLPYFATNQDKLFILLTPPPLLADIETVPGSSARARAINTWLVYHWLDDYPYNNVAVLDFFNVLTSNGGNADTSDLGAATGNHHRLVSGTVQHLVQTANNYIAYPSYDSHPNGTGDAKAMGELMPLINVAYHAWQGDGGRPFFMGRAPKPLVAVGLLLLD
jgi:hypothetical protein